MNVAIYLRKSRSEENSDPIETLARHKKILKEFASKKKYDVIKIYEEGVMSGDSLSSRPQMQQLLNDVSMSEYEAVLCMDIDRLSRGDMQDQGLIINTFKYSDTLIITPDKTYNLNDETDEELTEFKTFFARRELKTITRRLRRGLNQTIKEGGYVANAPYGYTKVYKNKKPTLEIVPEEAEFVKMIYKMYLEGFGATIIADELNRLGAVPHRSDKFNRNSVRHILKNPTFCGKIVWDRVKRQKINGTVKRIYNNEDKWIIVDGLHPAIIDEETFNKAQEIRKTKSIPSRSKGKLNLSNPLAGLVYCGHCGQRMQRGISKKIPYLLCQNKGCCMASTVASVEQEVLKFLKDYLDNVSVKGVDDNKEEIIFIQKQLKNAEQKQSSLIKQKNTLHDFLEQGIYDIDTFRERQSLLKSQLDESITYIEKLSDKLYRLNSYNPNQILKNIENLLNIYDFSSIEEQNKLLKEVIKRVEYGKKRGDKNFSLKVDLNI